ncbi:hypothetical protein CBL_11794 [Carabus blaptoides fortunei]
MESVARDNRVVPEGAGAYVRTAVAELQMTKPYLPTIYVYAISIGNAIKRNNRETEKIRSCKTCLDANNDNANTRLLFAYKRNTVFRPLTTRNIIGGISRFQTWTKTQEETRAHLLDERRYEEESSRVSLTRSCPPPCNERRQYEEEEDDDVDGGGCMAAGTARAVCVPIFDRNRACRLFVYSIAASVGRSGRR